MDEVGYVVVTKMYEQVKRDATVVVVILVNVLTHLKLVFAYCLADDEIELSFLDDDDHEKDTFNKSTIKRKIFIYI